MADEKFKDDFEDPPEVESEDDANEDEFDEEAESEFDEPTEDAAGAEAAEMESTGTEAEAFDDNLLSVHDSIVEQLEQQVTQQSAGAAAMAEDAFDGSGNILGVGLGANDDDEDFALDVDPGAQCVNLYVAEPMGVEEAKAVLVDCMGVSAASSDDVPVNVIVTGLIEAQPHTFRIRRAPGGVSCGHVRVTAGTLGCLARGRRRPRSRRVLVLSNNHVLANSNNARFGNSIIQPGRVDGGRHPRDRIAILERFVPIKFNGGSNFVDCATGWAWHKLVRRELLIRARARRFIRIGSRPCPPRRNQPVFKTGRTTQLTVGRVRDTSVTIRVNYGRGRVALFRDQIAIRSRRGLFSRGGDSGSVVVENSRRRCPVGLLFAGGGGTTFANKMTRVVRALDINLFT